MKKDPLDHILVELKDKEWVSGEEIAKSLNISRTWIWNHINKLKKMGFNISSSAKKGYRLIDIPDVLIPSLIKSYLQTQLLGNNIHFFEQIDSTQNKARELAEQGALEGTVVVCESQTKGRGRRGRNWIHIPYKSIAFSIILRPPLIPSQVMQLPLMAGVALADTIRGVFKLNCSLKWPNDLLIKDKKLAGILAEISGDSEEINYIILGIGINVNSSPQDIPNDIKDIATSIFIETQNNYLRAELIAHILKKLEYWYNLYIKEGFLPIKKKWMEMNATIGRDVIIFLKDKKINGKATEIDNVGNLVILDESGFRQKVFYGDVSLRNKE